MAWKLAAPALLLVSAAVSAQDTGQAAPSADEDIHCAAWAAYIVGSNDDPSIKEGLGYAMTYFLGLYEGKTGNEFGPALAVISRELDADPAKLKALDDVCLSRTKDFDDRLIEFGAENTPTEPKE